MLTKSLSVITKCNLGACTYRVKRQLSKEKSLLLLADMLFGYCVSASRPESNTQSLMGNVESFKIHSGLIKKFCKLLVIFLLLKEHQPKALTTKIMVYIRDQNNLGNYYYFIMQGKVKPTIITSL